MQIIENTIIGTRSAVLRLTHRNTPLQFLVFPMLHVASPRFYAEVAQRLRRCDLLVIEGVRGRSLWVWAITLSYRIIPLNRRSGLVVDNIPYRSLGVPLVNPDVTVDEITRGWRATPLRYRLLLWCVIPVVVVARLFSARRPLLSRDVAVSDLPSESDEAFQDSDLGEHFDRTFAGSRDQLLLDTLTEIHATRSGEPIVVAIVYGARHVPAIVRGLADRLRYRVRSAEWLTVLDA